MDSIPFFYLAYLQETARDAIRPMPLHVQSNGSIQLLTKVQM